MAQFEAFYHDLGPEFSAAAHPTALVAPRMLGWNSDLAHHLGLDDMPDARALALFSGSEIADETQPVAAAYAGHQFGNFVPVLGDGRAHLLGERGGKDGLIYDIQLKGSGQTPFSRRGDGRAGLGPVLREYVISEAMHALGVPTTRALAAAVSQSDFVVRQTPQPAAILTRVARSHIRVGSFQYFAARGQHDHLNSLLEFSAQRLALPTEDPEAFLRAVMTRQMDLVTQWMSVGFVHGVMNTDNTAISGETIDFGPCAFLEEYDPLKVFSSIDHWGRYAFMRQKDIIFWNLSQLASALIPLMPQEQPAIERFTQILHDGMDQMEGRVHAMWARKLNIDPHTTTNDGDTLITDLLEVLRAAHIDFTLGFASLEPNQAPLPQLLDHPDFVPLYAQLQARQDAHLRDAPVHKNPRRIPRNHVIDEMITRSVAGDDALFHQVTDELASPYSDAPTCLIPAPVERRIEQTFCGT